MIRLLVEGNSSMQHCTLINTPRFLENCSLDINSMLPPFSLLNINSYTDHRVRICQMWYPRRVNRHNLVHQNIHQASSNQSMNMHPRIQKWHLCFSLQGVNRSCITDVSFLEASEEGRPRHLHTDLPFVGMDHTAHRFLGSHRSTNQEA